MNNISWRRVFFFIFLLTLSIGSCRAQIFHKNPEKQLFDKTLGEKKEVKVKEPRSVLKAKRKQEANDRKLQKEYEKNVKRSQKRAIDIQSPEVQTRMKQNKKDLTKRDKEKKKKVRASTRKAGEKYKE
jgi:predicted TIM-barrel fold metal-dependent hydrolase